MPSQNIEGKLVYKKEATSKDGNTTFTRIGVKPEGKDSETLFITLFGAHVQTIAKIELGSAIKLTKVNAREQTYQGQSQINLTLGRFGAVLPVA